MLESVVLPGVLGFVWGLAVSLFNNYWTWRAFTNPKKKKNVLIFSLRQGINVLAMFLVYKNLAMLIGTALGLLAIKNYILVKNMMILFHERKG